MSALPEIPDRNEFDPLVIRTDFTDDAAWREVVTELHRPWGGGEFEASVHVVDDPAWAGATPEAVLDAVSADEDLSVVFLADHDTMRSPLRALLALHIPSEYNELDRADPADPAGLAEDPADPPLTTALRAVPAAIHDMHANLAIANLDFEDYAEAARTSPDGVLRPFS